RPGLRGLYRQRRADGCAVQLPGRLPAAVRGGLHLQAQRGHGFVASPFQEEDFLCSRLRRAQEISLTMRTLHTTPGTATQSNRHRTHQVVKSLPTTVGTRPSTCRMANTPITFARKCVSSVSRRLAVASRLSKW